MNQKEIVDKLEEILACVSCSEYTYNYGEIMVAAYTLWGFLYDVNILRMSQLRRVPLTFEQRMYNSLKRKGLAPKFEHAGIYAILLDREIVYIGKSVNMLQRMAQHYT